MKTLRMIGAAFIAAVVTALAFFAGLVISAVSAVVSTVFTVFVAFAGVFVLVASSCEDEDSSDKNDI